MKKIILTAIILSILSVIFLAGCTEEISTDGIADETDQSTENELPDKENSTAELNSEKLLSGECTPGWKCISSLIKAYQSENCSFGERIDCRLGCANDTCRVLEPCPPGFRCKNNYIKGFQLESCEWISTTKCEFGCREAECLPKPNATAAEEDDDEEETVTVPRQVLNEGRTVEINGQLISIYLLEPDRVKIKINERRSDWLAEGENYSSSGVKITIAGILYQAYLGGTRAVEYQYEAG